MGNGPAAGIRKNRTIMRQYGKRSLQRPDYSTLPLHCLEYGLKWQMFEAAILRVTL